MPTLHVEHGIVDFDPRRTAFDRSADVRRQSGVRAHRVRRPIDEPRYVLIDLDFDTADQALAFADLLRNRIWSSRARRARARRNVADHNPRDGHRRINKGRDRPHNRD